MDHSSNPQEQIGRFKILKLLDRGANSEVYQAYDPKLARVVALKLVSLSGLSLSDLERERFQQEVLAAGRLNHTHIVTIYDVDFDHRPPYLVMELLEGGNLKNYLAAGPLPWSVGLQLLRPLAEALNCAHQNAVIHRDVKPTNVMFTAGPDKVLKLVDFGLASREKSERITQTGYILGTPAYMSPEQANGERVDQRTDIFAFGIILFEAISGYNPLDQGSWFLTLEAVLSETPIDTSPLIGLVPAPVIRLIERAIAKERNQRFADFTELLLALDHCLGDSTVPLFLGAATTTTENASDRPNVKAASVELATEERMVLKRIFEGCSEIAVETEFKAGFSHSRVLQVRPLDYHGKAQLPVIAKIGPVGVIQQEWQAYQTWVARTLPEAAQIEAPPPSSWAGLSGLRYTLIGSGLFKITSLYDHCKRAAVEDLIWILQDRLFNIIGETWWLDNRVRRNYQMRQEYASWLPVDLFVACRSESSDEELITLDPSLAAALQLRAGSRVVVEKFIVTEIEPDRSQSYQGRLTLELPPETDRTYRIRIVGVSNINQYHPGMVVEGLAGIVEETRHDYLRRQAETALGPKIDLRAEKLILAENISLPNPLFAYQAYLDRFITVRISTVHGDLNLENILVDAETQNVSLIDFATTREGHVLQDLLRLETELVVKLVPEALRESNLPLETIFFIYLDLHEAFLQSTEPVFSKRYTNDLIKYCRLILTIRRMARQCFFRHDDWAEYYQGLILYLLGTLKFKNLKKLPGANRVAFLGAAALTSFLNSGRFEHEGVPQVVSQCPYRGLEVFDVQHAALFFGREILTDQLLGKLQFVELDRPDRLLAIIGPSGSGKSSLARAGVLATLKQDEILESADWLQATLNPGYEPLTNLSLALSKVGITNERPSEILELARALAADRQTLHLAIRLALYNSPPKQRLLILVDQFEEVFTLCNDEKQRLAFFDNLLYAAGAVDGRAIILLTLRSDFYGKCAAYPDLAASLAAHHVLVGPMRDDELRRAIVLPAQQARAEFEPGLVDQLLHDVQNQPGSLPLLQYTLRTLWEKREQGLMTWAAYENLGRVEGALRRQAETVYGYFNEAQQEACRRIFLRLTQLGEGTVDTRRRASLAELLPVEEAQTLVRTVIEMLAGAEARLIILKGDQNTFEEQYVEIAHEALMQSWPRLQEWLEEDRESLRIHHHLTLAANEWAANQAAQDFLYRGIRLAEVEAWAKVHTSELNAQELAFLQASIELRDKQFMAAEARRRHELEQAQALAEAQRQRAELQMRSTRRLFWFVIGLAGLFFVAVGAASVAWRSQQDAKKQAQIAQVGRLAAQAQTALSENRPQRSLLLATEALKLAMQSGDRRLPTAEAVLWQALTSTAGQGFALYEGQVTQIAISPEGRWLVIVSETETQLYDLMSPASLRTALRLPVADQFVRTIKISADGRWLVTVAGRHDPVVELWDLTAADPAKRSFMLTRYQTEISAVTFVGPEDILLTAALDGTVRLWNLTDPEPGQESTVLFRQETPISAISVDSVGRWVATSGTDYNIRLWSLTEREATGPPLLLLGPSAAVTELLISPDNRWLISGSNDSTIHVWDLEMIATKTTPIVLSTPGFINALEISADARWLVAGDNNGSTYLWKLKTISSAAAPLLLQGHTDDILELVISADSHWLVTVSKDTTIRRWDLTADDPSLNGRVFKGHDGPVLTAAINPQAQWLISGSEDHTVRLWFFASPQQMIAPIILSGAQASVSFLAISPDNRWLASGGDDGVVRLWNLPALPSARPPAISKVHQGPISALTISADGAWLASGGNDQAIYLWDLTAPSPFDTPPHVLSGHRAAVTTLAISVDGQRLVSGDNSGQIRMWDLSADDPSETAIELPEHPGTIKTMALSPDNRWLVTGGGDRTIRRWDLAGEAGPVFQELQGHDGGVQEIKIDPQSHWLVSASSNGSLYIWDLSDPAALAAMMMLSGHEGAITALGFSADGRWLASGGQDQTVRLWDLAADDPAQAAVVWHDHAGAITTLAFSPDNQWLATAGTDQTAYLWNLTEPDRTTFPITLRGHKGPIFSLAISADSQWLATGSNDQTVRLWALPAERLVELACRTAGRNLTVAEWIRFFPEEDYRQICPPLHVGAVSGI